MSAQDRADFASAKSCCMCGNPLGGDRVADHNHLIASVRNYRGAAHRQCNILARKEKYIGCWIHNLGYDSQLLLQIFSQRDARLRCIPSNKERWVSMSVFLNDVEVRFCDSFRMLPSSLDDLINSIPSHEHYVTKAQFPPDTHQLVGGKGAFPYAFMDSYEKVHHATLPPRHYFDNELNECKITDAEWNDVQAVWERFDCKTMADFTRVYLKRDCCCLADILNAFRKIIMSHFGLEVCKFYTVSSLSSSCILLVTKIELQLIADTEMYMFVDSAKRGGVSFVNTKLAYRSPGEYIGFWDVNSLYPHVCRTYPLPTGDYKWVEAPWEYDWLEIPPHGDVGFLLEVDCHVPDHLHDHMDDFPPFDERKIPPNGKYPKLCCHFSPKTKFCVSLGYLQLACRHGAVLDKVHRALSFSQSTWMQSYVDIVADLKMNAKTECERNTFKLLQNSGWGKFIERITDRLDLRLATNEAQLDKLVRRPTFLNREIISEHLTIMKLAKTEVELDRMRSDGA